VFGNAIASLWSYLPAAIIAAILSQFGAYLLLSRSLKAQREQLEKTLSAQADRDKAERRFRAEQAAEERKRRLQEAKLQRLRTAYAVFISASITLEQAARESSFLMASETVEQRDARVLAGIEEAFSKITDARVALMMETEGREVLDAFEHAVYFNYIGYRSSLAENAQHPGSTSSSEITAQRNAVTAGLEGVITMARTRLDLTEQVIAQQPEGHV